MRQYCSEQLKVKTRLDTSAVTNPILTIKQAGATLNIDEFTFPGDGVFLAEISGEQMSQFHAGYAEVQLRGFVSGEEFSTNIVDVMVKPVLLKEVISND